MVSQEKQRKPRRRLAAKRKVQSKKKEKIVHKKRESGRKRKNIRRKIKSKKAVECKKRKVIEKKKILLEILLSAVITFLVSCLVVFFLVSMPKVKGYAMTPTINDGERLLVLKHQEIRRFDLVEIRNPKNPKERLILRVIGRPGESLCYKDEQLFINGEEQPERFLSSKALVDDGVVFTQNFTLEQVTKMEIVPKDQYFLMGDNRLYAVDSRYFGLVNKKEIIGKVKVRIFPLDQAVQF